MDRQDIIVAPATPPGEGGVAIIRLSGAGCLELSRPFFRSSSLLNSPVSHILYHGYLHDAEDRRLDEVMFVYMATPRSFTAEDVVEVHCHGGHQTVSLILRTFQQAGARLAQPGEFSYRAFINGRIDLSQAEAIADLIHARSETSQSIAVSQLGGQLSQVLHQHSNQLKEFLALVEAWIDFPEEELPAEDFNQIRQQVERSIDQLQKMVSSYNTGRLYAEGVSLLLLGRTNVGKSSLMNALLGEERAIVTNIEGTTRDLLEEGLVVNGLPVRLIDTAGLRDSDDPIEIEGVERARARIKSADLILLLFDGSRPFDDEDLSALVACRDSRYLALLTKSDLSHACTFPAGVEQDLLQISTKTGEGLDLLRQQILESLVSNEAGCDNSVLLTNGRHQAAAIGAVDCLRRAQGAMSQSLSLEFIASDLREALHALGEITGETTTDDILDSIFSRFCIGK